MDNTALNDIKERLLKDNDTRRWREIGNANAFANGYVYGVKDTRAAVAAAEAAEQQAQLKPRTNLDMIRGMSAEMLAKWITSLGNINCDECPAAKICRSFNGINCASMFATWLDCLAKEDGNEH